MARYVLIHGAGDSGWAWHLVEQELRRRGHTTVAPDLPSADDSAGFSEYADAVISAAQELDNTDDLVVVGHSLGGFTAPLVADRMNADELVLLAATIPQPGERPTDWWSATGYTEAAKAQAERDGGLTGNEDPLICFYNGVPDELAQEALGRATDQSNTPMEVPWPMAAWPNIPTRALLFTDDRLFPREFMQALAKSRLNLTAEEVPGGHCGMLSHPKQLADALTSRRPAPAQSG